MRKPLARAALAAYLLVLFALTLGGLYQRNPPRNFVPFRTIAHDLSVGGFPFVVNVLGNLAAFLPVGVLAPLLLRHCSARRVAALGLALSLGIEVAQGLSRRRVADVDDLILNTLGALIGYGLWGLARRWSGRPA